MTDAHTTPPTEPASPPTDPTPSETPPAEASAIVAEASPQPLRRNRAPARFGELFPAWTLALWLFVLVTLGVAVAYLATQHSVRLVVNGIPILRRTHQPTVGGFLYETGLTIYAGDRIEPGLDQPLNGNDTIYLQIARPLVVVSEGRLVLASTLADDVRGALADAGIDASDQDQVYLSDLETSLDTPLPQPAYRSRALPHLLAALRQSVRIKVDRAQFITVHDGDASYSFWSSAASLGEALNQHGVNVYEGDAVSPPLQTALSDGATITLQRAHPLVLDDGGYRQLLRTRSRTLGDLLAELRIELDPLDYVRPDVRALIASLDLAEIVRVYQERYVEEIPIPFETRWEPDSSMEIDQRRTVSWGQEGAERRTILVQYENQSEVYRSEEAQWIAREPEPRVFNYGTKIVERVVSTPSGPVTYWRKIRMLATSYNAPTAGKPLSHPQYAITRTGVRARKGIIAVDPTVINLGQRMYVPGYGPGWAGDTGGAIKYRRIDLCYDDDNLVLWKKWVDVYLTGPVPDPEEINWVVPNWPVEVD